MSTKRICLLLFLFSLIVHLVGITTNQETTQAISKSFIIPTLAVYFMVAAKETKGLFKTIVLAALFFSWIGDVLLIFQESNSLFFLLGLGSFLAAHIFYVSVFNQLRVNKTIRPRLWMAALALAYYLGILYILTPHLGDMLWPVRIYGLVISCMLTLAGHMIFLENKTAGWLLLTGASLFVVSDSVLAINKFVQPMTGAGMSIMLAYGLAQLFIIEGVLTEKTSNQKRGLSNL